MFKQKRTWALSLALALVISAFAPVASGQADAASAFDMFQQVYKRATGSYYGGFTSAETPQEPEPEVQPPQPTPPEPEQPEQPEPEPEEPSEPSEPKPDPSENQQGKLADRILKTGEKYLGTPYKYGAPFGQTRTFDCSSFTKTAFAENGIKLPRSSRQQVQVGQKISRSQLQKGDLVFFRTSYSSSVSHVGIYAGNGKVLHTYGPGGVRYDSLDNSWLNRAYITARRVID